jgi:hypothetical protein
VAAKAFCFLGDSMARLFAWSEPVSVALGWWILELSVELYHYTPEE